jgi:hypothetical protein
MVVVPVRIFLLTAADLLCLSCASWMSEIYSCTVPAAAPWMSQMYFCSVPIAALNREGYGGVLDTHEPNTTDSKSYYYF